MENHMYTDQQEANALKTIENQTFDMERALYGSRDVEVKNCRFDGPADGESAFKECDNVRADHCFSICGTRSGMTTVFGSRIRR